MVFLAGKSPNIRCIYTFMANPLVLIGTGVAIVRPGRGACSGVP